MAGCSKNDNSIVYIEVSRQVAVPVDVKLDSHTDKDLSCQAPVEIKKSGDCSNVHRLRLVLSIRSMLAICIGLPTAYGYKLKASAETNVAIS